MRPGRDERGEGHREQPGERLARRLAADDPQRDQNDRRRHGEGDARGQPRLGVDRDKSNRGDRTVDHPAWTAHGVGQGCRGRRGLPVGSRSDPRVAGSEVHALADDTGSNSYRGLKMVVRLSRFMTIPDALTARPA